MSVPSFTGKDILGDFLGGLASAYIFKEGIKDDIMDKAKVAAVFVISHFIGSKVLGYFWDKSWSVIMTFGVDGLSTGVIFYYFNGWLVGIYSVQNTVLYVLGSIALGDVARNFVGGTSTYITMSS